MKPHPRRDGQDDPLRPRLTDMRHDLVELTGGEFFARERARFFPAHRGRPATSPWRVAGLLYLRHACRLSDQTVVARWIEPPCHRHFTGETFFQRLSPIGPSCMIRWRHRIRQDGTGWLLTKTIETERASGAVDDDSLSRLALDRDAGTETASATAQRHRAGHRPHENRRPSVALPAGGIGRRRDLRRPVRLRAQHPHDPRPPEGPLAVLDRRNRRSHRRAGGQKSQSQAPERAPEFCSA